MKNIQNVIDKLVNKVLAEQVTSRIENISSKIISEAEGKGCAESEGGSGCIKKIGNKWIIYNNKKGGVWQGGFESKKDAKDALSAFHANEGEMKETEDRGDFDGRKSKVVGVYSNIKKQRDEEMSEMEEEKHTCNECGMTEEMCECGGMYNEELKGNQSKIDKNKNGKIDSEDFKMLRKESKKRTLELTENEMIELIERIVMEQKAEGLKKTEKVLNQSKKENDSAIKAVTKKLKDYIKDGSEEPYTPEAKHFPQGNGEMKKTEKMMYTASDAVEEYIDQIARSGGMENLTYDEIKPNEDWVEMNIEGSSKTGNSEEYANAVPTDVNKKVNDRRKKNYLAKLKAQSYNKAPQPVYDLAGKSTHGDAMSAPDNLMAKLESTDEKSKTKINEEIQKMLNLSGYNKKTQ